jgi:hypothetical protein
MDPGRVCTHVLKTVPMETQYAHRIMNGQEFIVTTSHRLG